MNLLLWLGRKLRREPENLLSLLIAARNYDVAQASVGGVFRAGMRFALSYPDQAARILETPGHPGQTED